MCQTDFSPVVENYLHQPSPLGKLCGVGRGMDVGKSMRTRVSVVRQLNVSWWFLNFHPVKEEEEWKEGVWSSLIYRCPERLPLLNYVLRLPQLLVPFYILLSFYVCKIQVTVGLLLIEFFPCIDNSRL